MSTRHLGRSFCRPLLLLCTALLGSAACADELQPDTRFQLEEATILDIHRAYAQGTLTARDLTALYLQRIATYDQGEHGLHAVIATNSSALTQAEALDRKLQQSGSLSGPLHGIPVLIKDNLDTFDMPTTAGVLGLAQSVPPDDAFVVQRLRDAGAIILGKTNLMELGVSQTESRSSLGGSTANPYDRTRSSLGSSGGSAVAASVNLAAITIGTDTTASIASPAAANGVVGLRPTFGLVSRDGVVTGLDDTTLPGPLTRTVADAARVLDVIAGEDARDPSTVGVNQQRPLTSYLQALDLRSLSRARIGAVSELIETSSFGDVQTECDPAVVAAMRRALDKLSHAGATISTVSLADIDARVSGALARRMEDLPFKFFFDRYLETLGPSAPVHALGELVSSRKMLPDLLALAAAADTTEMPPERSAAQAEAAQGRRVLRERLVELMDEQHLDVLAYLTIARPPQVVDAEADDPYGVAGQLSAFSGLPSISVPIGLSDGLPVGMTLLARPFTESRLLSLAAAFEKLGAGRVPPQLEARGSLAPTPLVD
jgi:amidase